MNESSKPSYWRDTNGIVHILDAQYHVMLCAGLYRLDQDRLEGEFPTCFDCIAADASGLIRKNGEPGFFVRAGVTKMYVRNNDGTTTELSSDDDDLA